MSTYQLSKPDRHLQGRIALTGSKSISNRALIIYALTEEGILPERLAAANDTRLLRELLASDAEVRDAGPAGTTYRFLTAYLSAQPGTQVLTGSERMKQRPIGVLVDALRTLGAKVEYLEREGYPPLRIGSAKLDQTSHLRIEASTSSQYISALLLIAPSLPRGLTIELEGELVSRPYLEMTLRIMAYFGVAAQWVGNQIKVQPQAYQPRSFTVEADWSAASYYYSMAALAETVDLQIDGLFEESTQGDSVLPELYRAFGIKTTFTKTGIQLQKEGPVRPHFEYDFIQCPDLAQTVAVTAAGVGAAAIFTGLQTLRIKETDRIAALKTELAKVGTSFAKLPPHFSKKDGAEYFMLEDRAQWETPPSFATYEDHRMAMAFAPLALLNPIHIEDPAVVGKSYPGFWEDLKRLGFRIQSADSSSLKSQ